MEIKVTDDPVVAIVGVTGAVGAEFMATMDRRGFRVGRLKALASPRSAGKTLRFRGREIVIEELTETSFDGVDIALFSAVAACPASSRLSRSTRGPWSSTIRQPSGWIATCRW